MKIQLFIHLLDDKISLVNVSNTISVKNLTKQLNKKFNLIGETILKTSTNLLKNDITLIENNISDNDHIYIVNKVKGGIVDVLVKMLTGVVKLFLNLESLVTDLLGIVLNILEMIPNIFSPDRLINDIIYGINEGIKSLLSSLIGNMMPRPTKSDNKGNSLFGSNDKNKVVCIKPTIFTLLILIICPPFALLLSEGLKAWYLVIICALMTYYLYYIPGFIFAALHIMC